MQNLQGSQRPIFRKGTILVSRRTPGETFSQMVAIIPPPPKISKEKKFRNIDELKAMLDEDARYNIRWVVPELVPTTDTLTDLQAQGKK